MGFAELRWGGVGRLDRFRAATAAAPVIATRWSGLRERQTLLIAAMLTVVLAALVLPPFVFLLNASMVDAQRGGEYSFANFVAVLGSRHFLESSANSILFAAGSATLALAIGWVSAWIVERTNTPLKALVLSHRGDLPRHPLHPLCHRLAAVAR